VNVCRHLGRGQCHCFSAASFLCDIKINVGSVKAYKYLASAEDGPRAVSEQRRRIRTHHGDKYRAYRESLTARCWRGPLRIEIRIRGLG
jgi:hypothetical protein